MCEFVKSELIRGSESPDQAELKVLRGCYSRLIHTTEEQSEKCVSMAAILLEVKKTLSQISNQLGIHTIEAESSHQTPPVTFSASYVRDDQNRLPTTDEHTEKFDSMEALLREMKQAPSIEMPEFDASNVSDWLSKVERSFPARRYSDLDRLDLVAFSLEGDVLLWFASEMSRSEFHSWDEFRRRLFLRFAATPEASSETVTESLEARASYQVPVSSLEPGLSFSSESLGVLGARPSEIVSNNRVHSQSVLECVKNKANAYQVFDKTSLHKDRLKPKNKRKLSLSLKTWMFKFKNKLLQRKSTSKKRKSLDVKFFSVEEIVAGCEKKLFDRFQTSPSYALDVVTKTSKPWETHTPFTSTPVSSLEPSLSFSSGPLDVSASWPCAIVSYNPVHSQFGFESVKNLNNAHHVFDELLLGQHKSQHVVGCDELGTEAKMFSDLSQTSQVWEPGGVLASVNVAASLGETASYTENQKKSRCLKASRFNFTRKKKRIKRWFNTLSCRESWRKHKHENLQLVSGLVGFNVGDFRCHKEYGLARLGNWSQVRVEYSLLQGELFCKNTLPRKPATSSSMLPLYVYQMGVSDIQDNAKEMVADPVSLQLILDVNKTSKTLDNQRTFTPTPVASVNSLSFEVGNFELCVGHDKDIMRLKLLLHSGCNKERLTEFDFHLGENHGLLVFPWNLLPLEFFWFIHLEDKVCLSGASNSWWGWLVFDRGKSNIISGDVITLVSSKELWMEILDGDIAKPLNSTCGKLQSCDYGLEITFLRRLRIHQQQQKRKFIKSWRFKYKSSLRNTRSESREMNQFVGFLKFQLKHKWRSKHLHTISALGFYLSTVFSTVTSANFGRLQGLLEQGLVDLSPTFKLEDKLVFGEESIDTIQGCDDVAKC